MVESAMTDLMLNWWCRLLPLRAVQVELELSEGARFHWFHGNALYAFIHALLGAAGTFPHAIRPDAPESGRVVYEPADRYRFGLTVLPGGLSVVDRILARLRKIDGLPANHWDAQMPLGPGARLVGVRDLIANRRIESVEELAVLDENRLHELAKIWQDRDAIRVRFRTPLRIERERGTRNTFLDETHFDLNRFLGQLDLSLRHSATLSSGATAHELRPLALPQGWRISDRRLLWVDAPRYDRQKRRKLLGGTLGSVVLRGDAPLGLEWACHLVAAQYVGIGKSTHFGLGRLRLEGVDGTVDRHHATPAATHLARATTTSILKRAGWDIARRRTSTPGIDGETPDDWIEDSSMVDVLRQSLLDGSYRASTLFGTFVPKKDGSLRALAVPTVRDRVAQRAMVLSLRRSIDQLLEDSSHAYRRGLSRQTAATQIERLRNDGYTHVLETDIEDFFDSVDWRLLEIRLEALLGPDEPAIDLILQWIRAPVSYQGRLMRREQGLPQGAVISPLLANIFLDRFDEQMDQAGFRIVRYADDLLVLCRRTEDIERARETAVARLSQLGLALKQDKTFATTFDTGFRYLGYLFCRSVILDVGGTSDTAPSAATPVDQTRTSGTWPWCPTGTTRPWDETPAETSAAKCNGSDRPYPVIVLPPRSRISSREGSLVIERGPELERVPWGLVGEICLHGPHHVTGPTLHEAMERRVPVHLLNSVGQLLGTLAPGAGPTGRGGAPWKLWIAQAKAHENNQTRLTFAREVVRSKIQNSRVALGRQSYPGRAEMRSQLAAFSGQVESAVDLEELRGVEGSAAKVVFKVVGDLVAPGFQFTARTRRPPTDPVNAMLSFGYTILHTHVISALSLAGLVPWLGLYHEIRPGHAALASDLQEEFRYLIDLTVLRLIRRGQVTPGDFAGGAGRGVKMSKSTRRLLITGVEEVLSRKVRLKDSRSTDYRGLLSRQARRIADFVRNGTNYRAWRTR